MATQLQPADFTVRVTHELLHGVTHELPLGHPLGSGQAEQLAREHQAAQAVYSAQESRIEAGKAAVYAALMKAGISPDPMAAVRGPYVDARG